jgi:hypothetical protein
VAGRRFDGGGSRSAFDGLRSGGSSSVKTAAAWGSTDPAVVARDPTTTSMRRKLEGQRGGRSRRGHRRPCPVADGLSRGQLGGWGGLGIA